VKVGFGQDARANFYDAVLLDAPCSGLGSVRRKPESRWRKTTEQLSGLTKTQAELLEVKKKLREVQDGAKNAGENGSKSVNKISAATKFATEEARKHKEAIQQTGRAASGLGGELGGVSAKLSGITSMGGPIAGIGIALTAVGTIARGVWSVFLKDVENAQSALKKGLVDADKFKDSIQGIKEASGEKGLGNLQAETALIASTGRKGSVQEARDLAERNALPGGFKEAADLIIQAERPDQYGRKLNSFEKRAAIDAASLASLSGTTSSKDALSEILSNPALRSVLTKQTPTVATEEELAARIVRMRTSAGGIAALSGSGTTEDYNKVSKNLVLARESVSGRQFSRMNRINAVGERVSAQYGKEALDARAEKVMREVNPGAALLAEEGDRQSREEAIAYKTEAYAREQLSNGNLTYLYAAAARADESREMVERNNATLTELMRIQREDSAKNRELQAKVGDSLTRLGDALSRTGN
jgi:hypothetical protein